MKYKKETEREMKWNEKETGREMKWNETEREIKH